jgi:uncharacterized protein involved in exopolysaccharide biosynthesis
MLSTSPTARPEPPPPLDVEPVPGSEFALARDLAGLIARAPLRHRRLAAAVFLLGALVTTAAAIVTPRVYVVNTRILAQRNLVMPSLGNPRRSVPSDSDAPTRAANEVILGRDNLVAIIKETDLLARWDSERGAAFRLKDRVAAAVRGPLTEEDRMRALVGVLEKRLRVQADDSTIRISLEWSHPETAYRIVSCAERNFFEGRRAVEVAVIADTIGILRDEADRQREAVDGAFARVVQLRRDAIEISAPPAPGAAPPRVEMVRAPVFAAPAGPAGTKIAARLDEKRRDIRALDEPRQQKLAQLDAELGRLRQTYTSAHPAVLQVEAEMKGLRVEPPALSELKKEEQDLVAQLADLASPERDRPRARPIVAPRVVDRGSGAAVIVDASTREDEPDLATAKAKLLVATRKYEDLMDRVDSARIELHTAQAAFKYRYTVVEPPEVPKEARRPHAALLAAGGVVLSALLGVFAAAVRDLAGGRFVEAWQVRRLPVPLLAEVERP